MMQNTSATSSHINLELHGVQYHPLTRHKGNRSLLTSAGIDWQLLIWLLAFGFACLGASCASGLGIPSVARTSPHVRRAWRHSARRFLHAGHRQAAGAHVVFWMRAPPLSLLSKRPPASLLGTNSARLSGVVARVGAGPHCDSHCLQPCNGKYSRHMQLAWLIHATHWQSSATKTHCLQP